MTFDEFASRKYYYETIAKSRPLTRAEKDDLDFALKEERRVIAAVRAVLASIAEKGFTDEVAVPPKGRRARKAYARPLARAGQVGVHVVPPRRGAAQAI
jgi:hypothetical protein